MAGPKHSSASAYAASHLSLSVLALLSSVGFQKSSSAAANLLTEVLQRYIQLIGSTSVQHANHSGRNTIVPQDLRAALEHILGGDPIEEVLQWAEDEGRIDFDVHQAEETDELHATASQPSGQPNGHPAPASALAPAHEHDSLHDPSRGSDLAARMTVGRPRPSPKESSALHFCPIPIDIYDELEEDSLRRERRIQKLVNGKLRPRSSSSSSVSSRKGKHKAVDPGAMQVDEDESLATRANGIHYHSEQDSQSDSSFSSGEEDESASLPGTQVNGDPENGHGSQGGQKRPRSEEIRQFGPFKVEYVPSFLPAFPPLSPELISQVSNHGQAASPALPHTKQEEAAGDSPDGSVPYTPQETDLEYVEAEKRRIHLAQQAAAAASAAAAAAAAAEAQAGTEGSTDDKNRDAAVVEEDKRKKEQTAEERAAEAERAFQTMQARRVLRDCWKEAIPFETSTLAATYPASELVDLDKSASPASQAGMLSVSAPTSSLRAFAADYRALAEDPLTSGAAGIYLTPCGPAHHDAASKRRRLAHGISDPSRYTPNDSLYASVSARPAVIPFHPGPSWLVSTLPPPTLYEDDPDVAAALSMPILTPVLPQGRPAALIPSSGSLVPSLAYRHASHLSIGARIVASGELLKRVSRYDDPPPLIDDKHAERFFHGHPASRDLLGGSGSSSDLSSNISNSRNAGGGSGSGNSSLRSALEKLVLQLKEKEATVLPEEDKEELQRRQQELQLQLQAAEAAGDKAAASISMGDSYASRIRNGNITMVHTWDWAVRDPYDTGLPGRKVRGSDQTGTPPVALVASNLFPAAAEASK